MPACLPTCLNTKCHERSTCPTKKVQNKTTTSTAKKTVYAFSRIRPKTTLSTANTKIFAVTCSKSCRPQLLLYCTHTHTPLPPPFPTSHCANKFIVLKRSSSSPDKGAPWVVNTAVQRPLAPHRTRKKKPANYHPHHCHHHRQSKGHITPYESLNEPAHKKKRRK